MTHPLQADIIARVQPKRRYRIRYRIRWDRALPMGLSAIITLGAICALIIATWPVK